MLLKSVGGLRPVTRFKPNRTMRTDLLRSSLGTVSTPDCCLRGTVADGLPCSASLPTLLRKVVFFDPLDFACLGWFQKLQQAPASWSGFSWLTMLHTVIHPASSPSSTKKATSQFKQHTCQTQTRFLHNTSTENIPHMSQYTTTAQCQPQSCRA